MLEILEPKDLDLNMFSMLSDRWGLLTAADGAGCNPMTVSWGGVGVLWRRPVVTVYVRPQRYTYGLMEKENYFSLSFLPESRHDDVVFCGSRSGRNTDKVKACGLTLCSDQNAPYFAQAELTFICRKLYAQDMDPACFTDPAVDGEIYPDHDYHRVFVGEIEKLLVQKP